MKIRALWIFLGTVAVTVGTLLLFIQSKYFADLLKQAAREHMPMDFKIEGDFSELAVKMIPPGVVIKKPAVTFRESNSAGLPAGTRLDAQFIDVTFQFFQLLTGSVTINAFAINGATLNLNLDEQFFEKRRKAPVKKKKSGFFSWNSLVQFDFRSVSLIESQLNLSLVRKSDPKPLRFQAYAKEFTIGRSTVDRLPAYDLAVDLQRTLIDVPGFAHALSQFQASLEISSRGVALRNLALQEDAISMHANGMILGNVLSPKSLRSDIAYVIRGPVPLWLKPDLLGRYVRLPKGTNIDGDLEIEGKLKGDLLDVENTVETKATVQLANARYGEWSADKAIFKGAWVRPVIALESAEFHVGAGRVKLGALKYDFEKPKQDFKTHVELENADFRRLMGSALRSVYPLHMTLDGAVNAELSLGNSFEVEGTTDLKVRNFSFDNQKADVKKPLKVLLAIPELAVSGKFKVGPDGVRIDDVRLDLPRSTLKAHGKVDDKNGFDIDVLGKANMADVGKLGQFDINGEGQLHWTIKGKKPHVLFTFDVDMNEARYLNLNLGAVKGRVVYNDGNDLLSFHDLNAVQGRTHFLANGKIDLGDAETADMAVRVSKGTIQDFAHVFKNLIEDSVPWYPRELLGGMSGLIKVSGKTGLDQLSVEGDMEFQNVDYMHEIFRYGRMHAGYRRGAYIAENIAIQKKNGWLRGNMAFGADGILKYDLRSDNLTTNDIDHLASLGIPYRSSIQIAANGVGKLGELVSSFKLSTGDGFVKNYPVPHSMISFKTNNGRIKGSLSVFADQLTGDLDMGWARNSDSTFSVEARTFDFRPILVALNPQLAEDAELGASTSGYAHFKFRPDNLSKLSGDFGVNSYRLRRKGYSLELAKPVRFDIKNGDYEFADAKLVGNGAILSADGRVRNGVIDYNIQGDLNLGFFEFVVKELAAVNGLAKVEARITGRADSPDFRANIASNGVDLRLRSVEQPFENLRFRANWENDVVRVSDVAANFADGTVRGEGVARLYLYKAPDLDFTAHIDNSKVKVYPVVYARSSGRLHLRGSALPYAVKGSLRVAEAVIRENFSMSDGARVLRTSKFMPATKGGATDFQVFDLEVDIVAERNIFVKNDLFDAELKGNLKVINSVQSPRLLGNVTVLNGRLLFKDNFFVIQSGNLRFTNPTVIDPEFDLAAQTEMKGYKVLLVANGRVSDPNLTFQSHPPLSQNDVVNLLTLGVTSADFKSISRENRDAYSRDEMYGILFNQSGINKGLQEKLGIKVRVDQTQVLTPENAFRARPTTDGAETVSPKVVLQKQITKSLSASVGSTVGVGGSQERNADVEFGITKNWSVLGTYEDQRGSQLRQSRTSIGADVKYQIRFK